MNTYAYKAFTATILCLLMAGCAQWMHRPETPQEAFLLAEEQYSAVLAQAIQLQGEGRLSASDEADLSAAFDSYENSRDKARDIADAYEVIHGKDLRDYQTQVEAMNRALATLRWLVY